LDEYTSKAISTLDELKDVDTTVLKELALFIKDRDN